VHIERKVGLKGSRPSPCRDSGFEYRQRRECHRLYEMPSGGIDRNEKDSFSAQGVYGMGRVI
jgi:hypothetical protein